MGTNFYVRGGHSMDDKHIGKRSAGGAYCWDCKRTLCMGGETEIHRGRSEWHKTCPECGKAPEKESLEDSAAGKELGFKKNSLTHRGVRSICTFSWAIPPETLDRFVKDAAHDCPTCQRAYLHLDQVVEDEYGRTFTLEHFKEEILGDCPVQSTASVGIAFS